MAKKKVQFEVTEEQVIESYKSEHVKMDSLRRAELSLRGNISEILTAKEALNEIKQGKKGEKILVHLGAGVFTEAEIESNSKVKTNIGSNVVAETTVEKALESLEKQRIQNEKGLESLQGEIKATLTNLETLGTLIVQAQRMKRQRPPV